MKSVIRILIACLGLLGDVMAAAPRFDLVPLGVFGGEVESNTSCFWVRHAGVGGASLLIDCGSPVEGILRFEGLDKPGTSWQSKMVRVRQVLGGIDAVLLTHSHLDHLYGLVLKSPIHLEGTLKGHTTEVWSNGATADVLREHVHNGKLWGDFSKLPSPDRPAFVTREINRGDRATIAGFRVEAILLNHPVPASAYLITTGDASYLHLGDTGATDEVWRRARPLLRAGRLRAVALEASFPSSQEGLARRTGHLTPASLVGELAKLAGGGASRRSAQAVLDRPMEAARVVGRRIAGELGGVRILVHHIKPTSYDDVVRELETLRGVGLPIEVLQQGKRIEF